MPAKSKHAKKKRYQQLNKPKNIQNPAAAVQASATEPAPRPVAAVKTAQPAKSGSGAATKVANYDHVPGDLRRIGILMGIIIVILIVLSLILK